MSADFPLVSRSWNGTPISRRTTDGYVNATAMCKANGKLWNDYWRTDRCSQYLEALAVNTGNPVIGADGLVESRTGHGGGTWVHPQVAVDLARWISAPFAVWMDGWFLEELEERRKASVQSQPPAVPALNPHQTLDLIKSGYDFLEQLGVADDRDRIQFGDMVRNTVARGAGGYLLPPTPEEEELTISDAWLEVTGKPLPRDKGPAIGKLVAALYREEFGKEPPTRTQFVDGAPRKVKSYVRNFLIKAIEAVHRNMDALRG